MDFAFLEAGARNGEGDSRCRLASPSDAAFIQVENPKGEVFVRLDVKGSRDPVDPSKSGEKKPGSFFLSE